MNITVVHTTSHDMQLHIHNNGKKIKVQNSQEEVPQAWCRVHTFNDEFLLSAPTAF